MTTRLLPRDRRQLPARREDNERGGIGGVQATKGARWMPWQEQPKKGAASCEKLRGAASRQ